MNSIYWRPMMAALLAGLAAGVTFAGETRSTTLTAEQVTRLERHRADYGQAVLNGAASECVASFAPDVRLMPEYHGTLFGRTEAERYFRAFSGRLNVVRYERVAVRTWNLGERLIEIGRFVQTCVRRDDGRARELEGKYADVWSRSEGGEWEVIATTWNYSRWPEFADELRFSEVAGVRIAMEAHVAVKGGLSFELAALNRLQERAIVEKDHRVWSQFYADDAVLLPNHDTVREGRSEIDEYLESHVGHMPVYEKLDIRNDRIDDLGEWVIDYASHVAIWRNGEASGVNTGKNIRIWRREPRGGLKMVCQAGTYD